MFVLITLLRGLITWLATRNNKPPGEPLKLKDFKQDEAAWLHAISDELVDIAMSDMDWRDTVLEFPPFRTWAISKRVINHHYYRNLQYDGHWEEVMDDVWN